MDIIKNNRIYPRVLVGLLWGMALLNYMSRQMLSAMKEAMQVGISALEPAENFDCLMAVFLRIYGFMSPVAGMIADRLNRKWLIVGNLFVWSAVTYGMGYAETLTQLYWLRAIMGTSEALYIPAGLSLIADWYQGKSRSLAVGIHMTGLYISQAIGDFGVTVSATYSWYATLHGFGIIGIIYTLVLILFPRENKGAGTAEQVCRKEAETSSPSIFKGMPLLFSNIASWVILLYFAVPPLPGWATKNWPPTLFSDSLDMPMAEAGPLSTITIVLSSFLGVIAGGISSDRWVLKNIRGRVYTGAIGLGLMILALLLLGFSHSILGVVGASLLFGLGFGIFDVNNMPILCQFAPPGYCATAYGIMNMTGVFAGAAVTHLLGRWAD